MIKLHYLLVVEGKSDQAWIHQHFDVPIIITNGSALTHATINLIQWATKKQRVILLLDPDYQGKKIASKILSQVPRCEVCWLSLSDINPKKKKQGVAEAYATSLINKLVALNQAPLEKPTNVLTWTQYLSCQLNTKKQRLALCQRLNIPYFNHAQLFKQLVNLKFTYHQLVAIQSCSNITNYE